MKKIFSYAMLLLIGAFAMTACDDDNESNPTLVQPTQFVLNTPSVVNGTIDLLNSTGIELSWSQPTPYTDFNAPVIPTYTVQLSNKGSFNKQFDPEAEDNTGADFVALDETYSLGQGTVSAEVIDKALMQLNGWEADQVPETVDLAFRLKAAVRDASFTEYYPIYSNVVNLKAIPYYIELKAADPEIWWLIGADIADGSWGGNYGQCVIPMQTIDGFEYDKKTGQGEIQWIGYLGGSGFKLRGSMEDNWATQIGQNDGGFVKNDGGSGNITVSEPGIYKVTLNTTELAKVSDGDNTTALIIEKYEDTANVYSGMAIAGSFNDWGDTDMMPCSTGWENHDWYITHDFAANDEVKIKQAGSWDFNKGGTFVTYSEGMYVYGESNGPNLVISEAGKYLIIFNDITGYIRFIKQ